MNKKSFEDICNHTLGRTEPYDITSGEYVQENGSKVTFNGIYFDVMLVANVDQTIQSADGTVKVIGTIQNYMQQGEPVQYSFMASGSSDVKSQSNGIVID